MSFVIPIDNTFDSLTEEITLDLESFRFIFTFNSRFKFWIMEVQNRDLETLIAGVKLVLNYSLALQYVGRVLPAGEEYCIDTTNNVIKIDRTNLGTNPENIDQDVQLIYLTEEEIDSIS